MKSFSMCSLRSLRFPLLAQDMHALRFIRLTVSSIVTLLVSFFFLDLGHHLPESWISSALAVQFAPSFLKALQGFSTAVVALSLLVILTVVFGRVYCSHLCPLGAFQDIVIWLKKRTLNQRRFPYARPKYLLHYIVTAVIIALGVGGSMWAVNVFEPYSNTGRILGTLVRPALVLANNATAWIFKPVGGMGLIPLPIVWPSLWTVVATVLFAALVVALSYRSGRLFCNLLCPVGGILSLLSQRPAFAIVIRDHDCIDCGLCERVCRAQCIDSANRKIDTAACVGCFDCLESCPTRGMEFTWKKSRPVLPVRDDRRRVLTTMTAAVSTMLLPVSEDELQRTYDASKLKPVVPPGGADRNRFTSYCTACQLCVTACPTQVLQPSVVEYGWQGVFQPKMEYAVNYCTFDCVACTEVCPTGALLPLSIEKKHQVQLGKAVFVKVDCIVEAKKKDCAACAEHCPTKAVKMVPYEGKLMIPEVNNDYCVGCGACEHACPTIPRRAIYVDAHAVHQTAKLRPQDRTAPVKQVPQEFPF